MVCSCTAVPAAARNRRYGSSSIRPPTASFCSTSAAAVDPPRMWPTARSVGEHDGQAAGRHRSAARTSFDRQVDGLRRVLGFHTVHRLRRGVSHACHRTRPTRDLPPASQRDRLVLQRRRGKHLSGALGQIPRTGTRGAARRRPRRGYHQLLHSEDPDVAARAAIAWSAWEGSTSYLYPQADKIDRTPRPGSPWPSPASRTTTSSTRVLRREPTPTQKFRTAGHSGDDRPGPLRRRLPGHSAWRCTRRGPNPSS